MSKPELILLLIGIAAIEPTNAISLGHQKEMKAQQAKLEEVDLKFSFQMLVELSNPDSKTFVRGMGKCGGKFYIFFNRPYVYIGDNEIAINQETKSLKLLNLDPKKVRGFSTNSELVSILCGSPDACLTTSESVFMAVSRRTGGKCYMYTVDVTNAAATNNHQFAVFDLANELSFVNRESFLGFLGSPFSSCSEEEPFFRFLYFHMFKFEEAYCNNQVVGKLYDGPNPKEECMKELTKHKQLITQPSLILALDGAKFSPELTSLVQTAPSSSGYLFGSCIDGNNIIFGSKNNVYFKSQRTSEGLNFFGFKYAAFDVGGLEESTHKFFKVYIEQPNEGLPPDVETPGSANGMSYETIIIATYFTKEPPKNTRFPFSGMPLMSDTMVVTVLPAGEYIIKNFLGDETNRKYAFILLCIIITGFFLCGLVCLCSCCAARRRRHYHSRHDKVIIRVEPVSTRHSSTRHRRR